VPVEAVWRHRGHTARFLTRRFDQPQERVLAALGTASRVFAPIDASLRGPRPESCALSTREAADLVRDKALLLKARGFGVLLPGLETRLNVRLRLRGASRESHEAEALKTDGPGMLSFNSLVSYDWQLALGDQMLSPEEFEMLAQLKEPLVQLRGRWVDVRPDQIERALAFIQKHQTTREMPLAEALSTALAPTALDGVQVAEVEAAGWIDALLEDIRQGARAEQVPPQPDGFFGTLRAYQQRGVAWLATLQRYHLGALLADDMGLGKALSLDSPVLTPTGWKPMGSIAVGDEVINASGGVSCVTRVFPQGEKDLYRVVFSDGTSVECCAEHLWYVRSAVRKHRGQPGRVLPLAAFMHDLRDAAGNAKHYIPLVRPIEFRGGELPLDPYLVGVLLGDGGLTDRTVRFSSADNQLVESVKSALPREMRLAFAGGVDWRLIERRGRRNSLSVALRNLGLMGCGSAEKFIPDIYKFASQASRAALLQGLLDTDGCVRKSDNNIEYSTVSPCLARDVAFLVQSLGGVARIRTKPTGYMLANGERRACKLAYRMSVILPPSIEPFRLERKAKIYKPRPKYGPSRAIVDVIPVGRKPAQCISVDSPDGLYVTDHCIVTHNTAQVIALLLVERDAHGESGPTLVVCPTSVVGNWRHELGRFAPSVRVLVHHGAERAGGEDFLRVANEHDVVLSTYSLLHRDEEALTAVKWNGLVLDEAQNIKNASTRAAQAARAIDARWRVALTGTPVENRLADLWSIFQVINPGYLGNAEEFRRQFALPIERASDADATARLKALTAPFILRRLKTDRSVISDLPEKQEMKVYCSLTREQATLYEAVLQDTMRQIAESEGIQRRGLVLALLTRLKQVCNHPALLMHDGSPLTGRSGKLARLHEMLEEVVASDERALVFTQYAEMGHMLQDHLREALDREVLYLHGGTPMAERDRIVSEFQTDANGPPVFILSLKAGGTGLNLTRANHVFHFDRWWNPAVENQATDRAFRIGQSRNVQVHKYVCAGTFEETLDELIERKVALAESIVGTSEAWITEMSTTDLRQLFRLRREEAVAEDGDEA